MVIQRIQSRKFILAILGFILVSVGIEICLGAKSPSEFNKGTFQRSLFSEPVTFHPVKSRDMYSYTVQKYVFETLLIRDSKTGKWLPNLAEKLEVDPKGRFYKFYLRPGVSWQDGQPLTLEDVKYSFDAIKNGGLAAIHRQPFFENIKSFKIINNKFISVLVDRPYYGHLEVLGSMFIIPKHIYEKKDINFKKVMLGSGPYKLKSYKKGQKIVLEAHKDWWGRNFPPFKRRHNFKKIVLRIIRNEDLQIAKVVKGELDYLNLTSEAYARKTPKSLLKASIIKRKVNNRSPKGLELIAWNQKHAILKDSKVRMALSLLFNRPLVMNKIKYGLAQAEVGPWPMGSPYLSPKVKVPQFDPKGALRLLRESGWSDSDRDGVLDKIIAGSKRNFHFTLIYSTSIAERYLTIYKEDLKKVGIQLNLKLMEWSSFNRALKGHNFDAIRLIWMTSPDSFDPKPIFDSKNFSNGGGNYIAYNNPEVDQLIDRGRAELDFSKRKKIFQKFHHIIHKEQPYMFLFSRKDHLYLISDKIHQPENPPIYSMGIEEWWK